MKLVRHDYIVHLLVRGGIIAGISSVPTVFHQRTAYENSSKIFSTAFKPSQKSLRHVVHILVVFIGVLHHFRFSCAAPVLNLFKIVPPSL